MLTLDSILRTTRHNSAFGMTGKHVLGRGFEKVSGSFTEEASEEKPAEAAQELKPEGPK